MTSPHAIGLSGGFGGRRIDQLLFSLALPWRTNRPGKASQADSSIGEATAEREIRQIDDLQPPLHCAAGKSFRLRRSFRRAPVSFPRTSFSLFHRARRILFFSSGRKRENGGALHQPSKGCIFRSPLGEDCSADFINCSPISPKAPVYYKYSTLPHHHLGGPPPWLRNEVLP